MAKTLDDNSDSNEEKKLLEQLYVKEKKTTREIGKILGYSHQAIINKLNAYKIPIRSSQKIFSIAEEEDIISLYENNFLPLQKIAITHQTSTPVIRRILLKNGIKIRNQGPLTSEQRIIKEQ